MSKKRLTTSEMLAVSKPWVTKGMQEYMLLTHCPETAPLVPRLIAAREGLVSTQPKADDGADAKLSTEQAGADMLHDDSARAVFNLFLAHAYAATDAAKRDRYVKLKDLLLPDGLRVTQLSYAQEAGEGELREGRMTPEVVAQLKAVKYADGSAFDLVQRWNEAARTLGRLEHARTATSADDAPTLNGSTARNSWIRVVNGIESNLEVSDLQQPEIEVVLGRLRTLETLADRRSDPGTPTDPPAVPPAT